MRAGRYVRIFPPERFDTLRQSPDDPVVTKLLVPISQIREDVELMNDIAEVGARGFLIVSCIKHIEEPNMIMRENLS